MPSSVFSSPFGRAAVKTHDYNSYRNTAVAKQQIKPLETFQMGDTIPFVIQQDSNGPNTGGTYFSQDILRLPFASQNGFCYRLNVVEFGRDVSIGSGCVTPIHSKEEMFSYCRNEFSIERFVKRGATFSE